MKCFRVRLTGLSRTPFQFALVYYKDAQVYDLEDEHGRRWHLEQLCRIDRELVEKALIYELVADGGADAWGYH